jgi:uncharacterized protein (DUF1330 family)
LNANRAAMARWNARQRTKRALTSQDLVTSAVAAETIKDQAMFDTYRKEVPAMLGPFGGQFIVRGGYLTVVEGEWPHPRLVIIEFPSRAAAEG